VVLEKTGGASSAAGGGGYPLTHEPAPPNGDQSNIRAKNGHTLSFFFAFQNNALQSERELGGFAIIVVVWYLFLLFLLTFYRFSL
jgi:hypothetical protein